MSVGISLERLGDSAGAADAYRQAVEVLETAYEETSTEKELADKAEVLTLLGNVLHRSLGWLDEAHESYKEAAWIYRKLGEPQRLRKLLMNLAGLYWQVEDYENSVRHYEEALELARKHDEAEPEAAALVSLSVVYRDLDEPREAIRCGKRAVELLQDLEDTQAEAYVLTSLADSYEALEHYPSALSHLKRSLRLRRETVDLKGEIVTLRDLARVYELTGDTKRARIALDKAAPKEELGRKPEYAAATERS
jgi:tetratricopeptide (TPR) repeat protein